ncbi:hypothetical protein [Clostridium sp. MD294]|uniref:hypothetical protein n=1 Tax=Clostridium sp. MD294 TaxID=97138 RepID=UPI0002C8CF0C|nr:hypothetical protein [Clostridium sp. MD294]USF30127.1 hypothetical protein C820_001568 [Clostridium sp. MD294]
MQEERNVYEKEQFLKSKNKKWNKDVVQAVLKEGKQYSKKEAERLVKMYLEGKRERRR